MKYLIFLLFPFFAFSQAETGMGFFTDGVTVGGDVPRQHEIVLQASQVPGTADLTNFPVLITLDMLDTEVVDGGTNSAKVDGDDIQFYSDASLTTRLAVDIVQFVASTTAADRRCIIFVEVPTLSYTTNTSIYIRYNDASATQPAVDATYGSEDVWSRFNVVSLDGNYDRVTSTSFNNITAGTTTAISPYGNNTDYAISNFDGNDLHDISQASYVSTNGTSFYSWIYTDGSNTTVNERILHLAVTGEANLMLFRSASSNTLILGYENTLDTFIGTANGTTTTMSSGWHFVGGRQGDSSDMDLFYDGTFNTNDGGGLGSGSGVTAFYFGGRSTAGEFQGSVFGWLADEDLGEDWISASYNNQSSPSTFGIEQTPINAN